MERPVIRSAKDFDNIPKYEPSVDPKLRPLSRVITDYMLSAEHPCGLQGCHTPHKEGYLVELQDGGVTNVGWICGEAFGERFALEKNRHTERVLRPAAHQAIEGVRIKIRERRQELKQLAEAASRLSDLKQGFRTLFPDLHKKLERRAHSSDDRVIEVTERSEREISELMALRPSARKEDLRYKEELRGHLAGLSIWTTNIREMVVTRLTSKCAEVLEANAGTLPLDRLLEYQRWAHRFEESLEAAHAIVNAGDRFFATESFQLMQQIASVASEKTRLGRLKPRQLLQSDDNDAEAENRKAVPMKESKKDADRRRKADALIARAQRINKRV